jgi:hypothetical protein
MLIAIKPCQFFLDFGLVCHIIYSTCCVPTMNVLTCLIKTNAAQNQIIVRSSLKILKSTRRMSPSHLPMKLKSAASYKCLFIRLRLRISVM